MSHRQIYLRASWQWLLIWIGLPMALLLALLAISGAPAMLQAQSPTPTPMAQTPVPSSRAAVFPRLIKRLPLARGGAPQAALLRDFRRDPISGDLYVTDTGGQLHIVDGETLSVTATLPVGGELALDPLNNRLYVYPSYDYFEDEGEVGVTVVDIQRREIIGRLTGPRFVSLDPDHGRLFTGRPYSTDPTYNTVPVQIYDAESLELLEELPYYGIPLYNPRRDDLVVVASTALVVDLETYTVTQDLVPELAESPCPDCVGNDIAERAYFFDDDNLLALEMHRIATGAGAGNYPEPRFFDATSLRPITDTLSMPIWRASCSSQPHLLWSIDGRRYINDYYSRYVFYWNLRVEDEAGKELAFRDGLYASVINPTTRQMILDNGYVLALPSLLPVGQFYSFCWLDYDQESGLFFGGEEDDLLIMAERGGAPLPPEPPQEQPLPNRYITEILPSPAYAEDGIIYVAAGAQLFRSNDRGETWVRLRGGLPEYPEVQLDFAISPAFGEDRTLFAAGYTRTYHGEGVLRSQDGGETWTPLWAGLDYLRMGQVSISPRYAEDGQVAVSGEFARIGSRFTPSMTGAAVFTSTNRGLTWTLAMTASSSMDLPELDRLWGETDALPVRVARWRSEIEVQDAGGDWTTYVLPLDQNDSLLYLTASPSFETDRTIYLLGRFSLWRSTDGGATWARWVDERLTGRTYENGLSALAVAPLAGDRHELWLAAGPGELWTLQPDEMTFETVAIATPTPTPTPTSSIVTPTTGTPAPEATATPVALVPTPTPTPQVTPTPGPTLSSELPAGLYRPTGPLASLWEADPALQSALGWAKTEEALPIALARQEFVRGEMIWRSDNQTIYVVGRDGRWQVYPDTFVEGEPERDPTITPPDGLLQPIRGFGKLWRSDPEVRERTSWALAKEQGYGGFVQEFERGLLISGSIRTLALIAQDGNLEMGTVWNE